MNKTLRPYQVDGIEAVKSNLAKGVGTQMLVMATGTGKTMCATRIVKYFNKCLWITHVEELIHQSSAELATLGKDVGIIKQERMEIEKEIVVASIQTLWRRLDKIDPDTFDIIVIDECHLARSATFVKAIEHFNCKLLLGLTATPFRTDGADLSYLFEKTVYEYEILQGIKEGYLADIKAIRVRTQIDLNSVHTVAGDFNKGELTDAVDCPERNNLIVDKYLEYCKDRPALAFCVDVKHAMNLCETMKRRGLSADFVVGDRKLCPDRKDRIERFKRGETAIMVNVGVLVYGFDYPEIGCVITACPTKSKTKFVQIVGRGTRLKKNFKDCIILDVVDVTSRHRLVNTRTMDEGKPGEEMLFIGEDMRSEIAGRKKHTVVNVTDEERVVDMFKLPEITTPPGIEVWGKRAASEKQLQLLKKFGYPIDDDTVYTRGHAFTLIAGSAASQKQVAFLAKRGYDLSSGCNYWQAREAIDQIAEKESWEDRGDRPQPKSKKPILNINQIKNSF